LGAREKLVFYSIAGPYLV